MSCGVRPATPRKLLRDVPHSTGSPSTSNSPMRASSSQFCSAVFANPKPGSTTSLPSRTPASRSAATDSASSRHTSVTMSSYAVCCCMSTECPRQCIATNVASLAEATSRIAGSASAPLTSLMMSAPAATAASATLARIVSTLTRAPAAASSRTTGMTRRASSSALGRWAPGRVDSPPTSRMSAPCATSCRPCSTAAAASNQRPPSLNESGVTLTTAMTSGRRTGPSARGDEPSSALPFESPGDERSVRISLMRSSDECVTCP